jgi:hypothetical protein
MDLLINNLSTRNMSSFQDIEPKILDISKRHLIDLVDSTTYAATSYGPNVQSAPHIHSHS